MKDARPRVRTGTARRRRGVARVNKILGAAKTLFLSGGYSGLRLRRVAEMADISLGNLTYYFSSKADLFESMIDQVLAKYNQAGDQSIRQHADDPATTVDSYFGHLYADCQNEETQQFFYQFWATTAQNPFVAKARARVYASFFEQLAEICKLVNPALKGDQLSEKVYLLMALVEGLHVVLGNSEQPGPLSKGFESEFKKQAHRIIKS